MNLKKSKSNKVRRILKDDRGVSPVIAVILMVAITVVMAAIVSSWSAGVKAPTTPTTVGMDISRDSNNISIVITAIDPASSAPLRYVNASMNASGTMKYLNMSSVNVGMSGTMDTGDGTIRQVIVLATFKDGSSKVLYSRET